MELEKLFEAYRDKERIYSESVMFDQTGKTINERKVAGKKGAVTKAHSKFSRAFKSIYGNNINKMLEWQNARI